MHRLASHARRARRCDPVRKSRVARLSPRKKPLQRTLLVTVTRSQARTFAIMRYVRSVPRKQINMGFSLGSILDRWSRVLIAGCIVYSCVIALVLLAGWGGESTAEWISAWATFPVMITMLVMMWSVITERTLSPYRRRAFQLMFAAGLLDLVASVGWGYSALTASETFGSWPDVVWLFYYPLFAWACGLLYFDLGGRLDTTRSIVDFATLVVGFGALLWFTALAPLSTMNAEQLAENWSAAGYGIGNGICIIAGAMVAMQINGWRGERAITWMLLALLATLVADLLWVNAELSQAYHMGAPMDLVYLVYYCCMV